MPSMQVQVPKSGCTLLVSLKGPCLQANLPTLLWNLKTNLKLFLLSCTQGTLFLLFTALCCQICLLAKLQLFFTMTKLCGFSFLLYKIVLINCDALVLVEAMSAGVSRNSQQKLNPNKQVKGNVPSVQITNLFSVPNIFGAVELRI